MKKNKNLYFLMCDGFYLTTRVGMPHFSSNCPYLYTSIASARARLAYLRKSLLYSIKNIVIVKAVIDNA